MSTEPIQDVHAKSWTDEVKGEVMYRRRVFHASALRYIFQAHSSSGNTINYLLHVCAETISQTIFGLIVL